MNCKPGDLAMVIARGSNPLAPDLQGHVLRCIIIMSHDCGDPAWCTDPPYRTILGEEMWINDSALRPIRDPGDDATDETLLYRHVKPPFMREPA